jgi:RHS repeat-associated protein
LNRRITETYPDAAPNTKSFTYDAVGNVLTRTDQKSQVQSHLYDDLYRLLTRSTPGWPADTFSYDIGGRMLTATRAGWVVTYTYDAANRVSQSTQGTQSIGYSYNIPAGTRTITYPSGRVITEQSDLRGRLAVVKEGAVNIATYSYDNGNRVDTRTYQNGVVADYPYDANNRITSLMHNHGATLVAGFTHQYDDEGNKKNEEKLHQTGASEAYAYDSIHRLVDYKVDPLVAGTVPVPVTQTAYNLDAVGNWDSKTTDAVTETRTHNAANEITQIDTQAISHDNNGNLIQDTNYDYTFDENNRLTGVAQASVPVASYAYDALGRRISKTVGPDVTVFYYDNARIIEERDGSNNVQATYTFGNYIDEVLTATRPSPLGTLYYHQNTLWSVHALTDASGAVVERYTYDAYGAISVLDPVFVPLSSAPLAYFTYTGREYDADTGLYHYRARTYGPRLGRFYSRDPLAYVDGIHLYLFVRNNPTQMLDPTGLVSLDKVLDLLNAIRQVKPGCMCKCLRVYHYLMCLEQEVLHDNQTLAQILNKLATRIGTANSVLGTISSEADALSWIQTVSGANVVPQEVLDQVASALGEASGVVSKIGTISNLGASMAKQDALDLLLTIGEEFSPPGFAIWFGYYKEAYQGAQEAVESLVYQSGTVNRILAAQSYCSGTPDCDGAAEILLTSGSGSIAWKDPWDCYKVLQE